jgi:hypothetical protein
VPDHCAIACPIPTLALATSELLLAANEILVGEHRFLTCASE